MSEATDNPNEERQNITVGMVIRWLTIGGILCTVLGGGVYKIIGHDFEIADLKNATVENDKKSSERDSRQEKEIDSDRARISALEQSNHELTSKVDRALVILERIDTKVGKP